MMRLLISLLCLLLIRPDGYAQNHTGTWGGTLTSLINTDHVAPTIVNIRTDGTQFSGEYWLEFNGTKDKYLLQGTIDNARASGTATYPVDGTVFQIEAFAQNGQLVFAIGLLGVPIWAGTLSRQTNASGNVTGSNQASVAGSPSKVPRATGIAGQWEQKLQGRRLFRYNSRGGLIHKWYFDLCSDGSYSYFEESYMSGLSSNENEMGIWRIVRRDNAVRIVFSPQNKASYEKILASINQSDVVMDGQRYSLNKNQSCQ